MSVNKNVKSNYECYKELSCAIVKQAAEDYLEAKKQFYLGDRSASYKIASIRRFFRSEWYSILCSIDGEYMIKALDEEHERRKANNFEDDT